MKKRCIGILGVLLSAVLISAVGVTWAKVNSSDSEENNFQNGELNIKVEEKFTPPKEWDGSSYQKEVGVTNNSTVNSIIRVSIQPRWIDESGNPWAGDVSRITYKFSDDLYSEDSGELPINNSKWIPCKETNGIQYYYYNTILKNGDTTNDLIKEAAFNQQGMPPVLLSSYNGKKLIIDVKAEAVMAEPTVIKATWGDSTGDLKIDNMLSRLCSS